MPLFGPKIAKVGNTEIYVPWCNTLSRQRNIRRVSFSSRRQRVEFGAICTFSWSRGGSISFLMLDDSTKSQKYLIKNFALGWLNIWFSIYFLFLQEKGFKYSDYYVKVFVVFCEASQLIVWFTKTSKILCTIAYVHGNTLWNLIQFWNQCFRITNWIEF